MKQLNENWFAITLIAVIFGLLGFLLGKQQSHPPMKQGAIHMKKMGEKGLSRMMMHKDIGKDGNVEVNIDTIIKNGEKHISVRVIKEN